MTARPISCAFEQLYPGTAGFPEPQLLEAGDMAAGDGGNYGIEVVAQLFPAQGYGAPFAPDIFVRRTPDTDGMEPLYRDIAIKAASPVMLVRLARAITCNSIVYVRGGDLRVVYETQRWNDRAATLAPTAEALREPTPFPIDADIDYLFLASAGSPNYGHVLVDDLPRLEALECLEARSPGRRRGVIFPSFGDAIDQVRRDAVAVLCGPEVDVRFVEAHRIYAMDGIFYVSPCSLHPTVKNPGAIEYLRSAATGSLDKRPGGGQRLFVDRPARDSRQLLNGADVADLLRRHGYRWVFPEQLTFAEQVRLFAGADRVVGQMGAAMTNTLFCAAGSDILYLAPQGWIEPFYWDLAVIAQQRYRVLYGATSPGSSGSPHLLDCKVDLDDLERALAC